MKEIIYYQKWSDAEGLGDMLQVSTLPRRFNCDFYLSDRLKYRNKEMLDLLLLDPHIKGVSNKTPNLIFNDLPIKKNEQTYTWIQCVEATFGFEPPYNTRPVIYYKPKLMPEFANISLVDFSAISIFKTYDSGMVANKTREIIKGEARQVVLPHINTNALACNLYSRIVVNNIFHYCDLMHSCKSFIGLNSGGVALACAIKPNEVYSIIPENYYRNLHMIFDGINYVTI